MNTSSLESQSQLVRQFILYIGGKLQACTRSFESECQLNRNELSALFTLAQNGPLAVKEIAKRMPDVSLSTLTRLIDSLEQKGCAERSLDPADRRSFVITLTDKAKDVMSGFPSRLDGLAQTMLEGLTPVERIVLLELFGKMQAHLDKPAAEN